MDDDCVLATSNASETSNNGNKANDIAIEAYWQIEKTFLLLNNKELQLFYLISPCNS